MKKCILAFALTLAFSLVSVAQGTSSGTSSSSGQSDTAKTKTSSDKTAASSGKEKGVTGCLEQGTSPGTYVIKNAKHPDGVQVSYSGSEDLSKHVGHKVKATGSMSGGSLNATDVKHISETCSVGQASNGGHKHHHKASGESGSSSGMSGSSSGSSSGTGTNPPPK